MSTKSIGITTAKIHFYDEPFHYIRSGKWVWTIKFENAPMFIAHNRLHFDVGFCKEHAITAMNAIKEFFSKNFIFEDSTVAIIYSTNQIIAIGTNNEDRWIDVRDLKVKTFSELNLNISSLVVKF